MIGVISMKLGEYVTPIEMLMDGDCSRRMAEQVQGIVTAMNFRGSKLARSVYQ